MNIRLNHCLKAFLSILALSAVCTAARAMEASDGGVFVALDEAGEPVRKVLRVTRTDNGWKFEDQLEDGSWLDVSCHGGCDHVESGSQDLLRFFGSLPPDDILPDCIHNNQYAFCHLVRQGPGPGEEGFVLIVRAGQGWHPISMARLSGPEDQSPEASPSIEADEAARADRPRRVPLT